MALIFVNFLLGLNISMSRSMAWSNTVLCANILFRIWPPFLGCGLLNVLILQKEYSKRPQNCRGQIAYNALILIVFLTPATGTN
jgi:hypothetical protein